MVGWFLGFTWLGVYGVAITVSDGIGLAVTRIINSVLFPVLTEAGRTGGGQQPGGPLLPTFWIRRWTCSPWA